MLTFVRRFLVLAALMYWQGGFVFYAAEVVPIGTEVLGGKREQGFITRHVARRINIAGAVALVPLVWDVLADRDRSRWRRGLRWLAWLVMLTTLLWLFRLHPQLDELLVEENQRIRDLAAFRSLHRLYLWVITVQWAFAVFYAAVTLISWRAGDMLAARPAPVLDSSRALVETHG